MIPQATIQKTMLSLLEKYTGCLCVPSNTTNPMPAYPYISFNVINTSTKKGTYAEATVEKDGEQTSVLYMPLLQVWSFTAQSNNDAEAMEKAMLISDFFAESMRQALENNNIIVADIGAITPRDNLLTIEYEYRKGLDVTLRFNNIISDLAKETIEKATLTNDTVGDLMLEKE